MAWAFELTPEGIKRETAVDPAESITHLTGRKLDFAIIGLLVIAVVYLVIDNYILGIIDDPRGEKKKALAALRQAIDEGWRFFWWYYLKRDPYLESLHDEPEFHAMIAEIEADMAAQLARVREIERNGELEPIPEVVAE